MIGEAGVQPMSLQGFALSPQQRRLWNLRQEDGPAPYVAWCEVDLLGTLDTKALAVAVREVVACNEILRTSFRALPGMSVPLQVIGRVEPAWERLDLGGLPGAEQEREIAGVRVRLASRAGTREPMAILHLALLRLDAGRHRLLLALPALCTDAAGIENLVRQIAAACSGSTEGDDGGLQYADVAAWQNDLLEREDTDNERQYWLRQDLADLGTLRLPFEHAGTGLFAPGTVRLDLPPALGAGIRQLARAEEWTLRELFLSCWYILLERLTGKTAAVGVAYDGRNYEELQSVVGLLARHLPLTCQITSESTLRDVVKQVRGSATVAQEMQEFFSWEALREEGGATAFSPFCFELRDEPAARTAGPLSCTVRASHACFDRFRIKLTVVPAGATFSLEVHYDSSVLAAAEALRLAHHLGALLESAVASPRLPVGDLAIFGEEERHRLLVEANDTRNELSPACLHELFERQAARTPDSVAVEAEDETLTFAELARRARRLAGHLQGMGVLPEVKVGIFLERGLDMVVGLLGTLLAGGAYVPLDPAYPEERLELMLADSRPEVVLSQARLASRLPGAAGARVLLLEEAARATLHPSGTTLLDLAYVIYTSGSTGRPKGVMVSHGAIVNRLLWMQRVFPLTPADRVLQKTPVSFDASIWELFLPLLTGARVVLARPGGHQDNAYLVKRVVEREITVLQLVPSQLRVFLDEPGVERCVSLHRMFCGGEALAADLVERFRERLGSHASLHNLYGPTESAIDASSWSCRPGEEGTAVPIGRPIDNVELRILDRRLQPLPAGVPGELYIAGAGLARGYLGQPSLTAERFVPCPAGRMPGARTYRTGDLARLRPDGAVEYLGRLDDQVKVRGFRIELGEIEEALRQHPGVREAVVAVRDDFGDPRLVAYAVSDRRAAAALSRPLYRLSGGLEIDCLNRNEAALIHEEIFSEEVYLQHGVQLPDDACVLDVGANIGLFTLFVHQRCRTPRVYSFEPVPATFERLRNNTALYGLDVQLFDIGLSDAARQAKLTFYPRWSAMSGLYADAGEDERLSRASLLSQHGELAGEADELLAGRFEAETFTCTLRTLSEVIREQGIDTIDLLKLDVEKSELDVLRGLRDEDWPRIRQMVVELHDTAGRLQVVTAMLEERGFRVVAEEDRRYLGTGLYNVYAVRPDRQAPAPGRGKALTRVVATPGELRELLVRKLPEHMIPSAFMMLDALPRTASGKLDRRALPAPDRSRPELAGEFQAPRTTTEEMIAGIWADVLGTGTVGVRDNFFYLGGHSLLMTQIASRLREAFRVDVSLRSIFENPTVAGLATWIEEAQQAGLRWRRPPLGPAPRPDGRAPLSFAQQRLWFLDQLEPGNAAFIIHAQLRLSGALDHGALQESFTGLVSRHEVLRTTFSDEGDQPVQVIAPPSLVLVPRVDLSGLPAPAQAAEAERLRRAESRRPFDLRIGPLLRPLVLRLDNGEHILLVSMHHVISDGWSRGILVRELTELYRASVSGQPPSLPELPIQYADFAAWQRGWLQGEVLDAHLVYWRDQLTGSPPLLALPTDRPRPAVLSARGATESAWVPEETRHELVALCRREGVTPFMALATTLQILLSFHAGQDDIVLGTDVANRERVEIEGLIGFFVNQMALRLRIEGDPTYRELLARVREATLGAYAHQNLPFEKLVETLQPERSLGYSPVFQIKMNLHNLALPELTAPGLIFTPLGTERGTAQLDLIWNVLEVDQGFRVALEYSTDLFEARTASRLLEHFAALLATVAVRPESRLSALREAIAEVDGRREAEEEKALEEARRRKLRRNARRAVAVDDQSGADDAR